MPPSQRATLERDLASLARFADAHPEYAITVRAHPLDTGKGHNGTAAAADEPNGRAKGGVGRGRGLVVAFHVTTVGRSERCPEDAIEACTHLGLRLADKGVERGKIGQVGRARQ